MNVVDAFIQRTKQRRARQQGMHPSGCSCSMCGDVRSDVDAQRAVMDAALRRSVELDRFFAGLETPNIVSGPMGSSVLDVEYQPRVRR